MTKLRSVALWKLLSGARGCWSLLKYAGCLYGAHHALRGCTILHSLHRWITTLQLIMPICTLSDKVFCLSAEKRKILIYPSAMTERCVRLEMGRTSGRVGGAGVGYARDRNIHRDEDAETKKQRVQIWNRLQRIYAWISSGYIPLHRKNTDSKALDRARLHAPSVICAVRGSVCYTSTKWPSMYGKLGMKDYGWYSLENLHFKKREKKRISAARHHLMCIKGQKKLSDTW